jgi:hypothetical protein
MTLQSADDLDELDIAFDPPPAFAQNLFAMDTIPVRKSAAAE